MPRIPTIQQTRPQITGVPVGAFGAPERATAAFGEGLGRVGERATLISEEDRRIAEAEKKAERTLKSLTIDREIDEKASLFAESLEGRTDYGNFETETEKFLESTREEYLKDIADDKILQIAFERKYNQKYSTLLNVARDKKRQVITENSLGEFERSFNDSLQNYAGELDEDRRELIKKNIEIDLLTMVDSHIMTPVQAEQKLQSFNDLSEQVRADQLIEADPEKAEEEFKTGEFATLDPKIRQDKIEKAQLKQRQNTTRLEEEEKKTIAAQKILKEENASKWTITLAEEGTVDLALIREDLKQGRVTRAFYNSIRDDVLSGRKKVSDGDEILLIEEGIKKESVSRDYILENTMLSSEDKRALLDRMDEFDNKQFKEAYDRGEEQLKSRIITTSFFLPQEPGEAERFSTAKSELYERLKGDEELEVILKDMIPRYDSRPDKISALPRPKSSPKKPQNISDVEQARKNILEQLTQGTIDINTPAGQQMVERELKLLKSYQEIFERLESDGR